MSDYVTRQLRFEADSDGDGNTLVGVGVPFWEITRIDNPWEGTFDEQFAPGAFARSIGRNTPVLQFDHGTHPLLGSIPLGHFDRLEEVPEGLAVRAPILQNWLTEPVRDAIRVGGINGMSIRFRPRSVETTPAHDREDADVELRTVTEAELVELGPVVFPQYEGTTADMRSFKYEDLSRLARALLIDSADTGRGPGDNPGLGPGSEAEPPAVIPDQDSLPSGRPPSHRTRARRARLHHLEYSWM